MGDGQATQLLLGLALALIFGLVGANIGSKKGYSPLAFFALGFFCTIAGVIVAAIVPAKK